MSKNLKDELSKAIIELNIINDRVGKLLDDLITMRGAIDESIKFLEQFNRQKIVMTERGNIEIVTTDGSSM